MSLLPQQSGELEKKLEQLGERYVFHNPTVDLWNSDECPENALIYLAWALSVDNWSESWPLNVRRNVVKKSLDIHRMKGTTKGLQDALNTLGFDFSSRYWHQDSNIAKGKFRVKVAASNVVIDEAFYTQTLAVIDENKRGTLHLERLEVQSQTKAHLKVAAYVKIGERIRILPRKPEPSRSSVTFNVLPTVKVVEIYRSKPI